MTDRCRYVCVSSFVCVVLKTLSSPLRRCRLEAAWSVQLQTPGTDQYPQCTLHLKETSVSDLRGEAVFQKEGVFVFVFVVVFT